MKRIVLLITLGMYLVILGIGVYYWLYGKNGYFTRLEKEQIVQEMQDKQDELQNRLDQLIRTAHAYEQQDDFYLEEGARRLGYKRSNETIVKVPSAAVNALSNEQLPTEEDITTRTAQYTTSNSWGKYLAIIFGGMGLVLLFLLIVRILTQRTVQSHDTPSPDR